MVVIRKVGTRMKKMMTVIPKTVVVMVMILPMIRN